MTVPFTFAILGLASGGIYTLLALGIVVIHRASGTVNFANGAVAVSCGYLFYDLREHNLSVWSSLVLTVLAGMVLGLLIDLLVLGPLRRASTLTRAIASLGVLVILQATVQLRYGSQGEVVKAYLPQTGVNIFGAHITVDYLIILGVALVLTVCLSLVYRRTRFGLATSAASDNVEALQTLGWSTSAIARGNWALCGALAALAGALIAPITGLSLGEMTDIFLPALAAALFGGLASFGWTMAGALGIGVLQSELTYYSNSGPLNSVQNVSSAIPFLLIVIVLVVRGTSLPTRDYVGSRLPALGSGRTSIPTLVATLVALVVFIQFAGTVTWVPALTTTLIAAILLLSLVVLIGYAGQLSLAQLAMAGVGGLVAVRLSSTVGLPFLLSCLLGILAAGATGFVVGLPAVRTRGVTLAVVTLSLASALNQIVFTSQKFARGTDGVPTNSPKLLGLDIDESTFPRRFAFIALIVVVLLGFGVSNLRRSLVGRRLIAVRNNERAAASLGIKVATTKLYAFVVSSLVAGVGGVLIAYRYQFALFNTYDPFASVNYVIEGVIGGVGFVSGVSAGTGTEPGGVVAALVDKIGLGEWLLLVGGILLVVTLVANPDGVAAEVTRQKAWLRGRLRRRKRPAKGRSVVLAAESELEARDDAVLRVERLSVTFGAVKAVNDISFDLRSGEVLGVIGPNGAGKTTLIDAITGYVPASGTVRLDDEVLSGRPASVRSRAGVVRSFQSLELFEDLTAGENLLVSAEPVRALDYVRAVVWPGRRRLGGSAVAAVRELGLESVLDELPAELSYGRRRLLAIARAVAMGPAVLLLDEPAAGLDIRDRAELSTLIGNLARRWNMAIVLIEHDVELVMSVSTRVLAMNFGTQMALGSPDEVRADRAVVDAYLGDVATEPTR